MSHWHTAFKILPSLIILMFCSVLGASDAGAVPPSCVYGCYAG